MTEQEAAEKGMAVKIGRFPFTASGKATAAGDRDGFVKLLFDADDKLVGAHMVGANVTEMLAEPTLARTLGATAEAIVRTVHAHPTLQFVQRQRFARRDYRLPSTGMNGISRGRAPVARTIWSAS